MVSVLPDVQAAYTAGLCLLPAKDDGTKRPDVPSWTAFQSVRPTPDAMREYDFASRAGFGMIAGPVSGHRECWDFDAGVTRTCPGCGCPLPPAARATQTHCRPSCRVKALRKRREHGTPDLFTAVGDALEPEVTR